MIKKDFQNWEEEAVETINLALTHVPDKEGPPEKRNGITLSDTTRESVEAGKKLRTDLKKFKILIIYICKN